MLLSCFPTIYFGFWYISAMHRKILIRFPKLFVVYCQTKPCWMGPCKKFFNRICGWFQSHLHFWHGRLLYKYMYLVSPSLLMCLDFSHSNLNILQLVCSSLNNTHQNHHHQSCLLKFYAIENFEHAWKVKKKNQTNEEKNEEEKRNQHTDYVP